MPWVYGAQRVPASELIGTGQRDPELEARIRHTLGHDKGDEVIDRLLATGDEILRALGDRQIGEADYVMIQMLAVNITMANEVVPGANDGPLGST